MTPLDRSISQEQASQESDFSGDSQVSDHLAYLEHHNKNIEMKVVEACDEIARMSQKLNQIGNTTEHLRKWCDSLQNQIRMLQAEKMGIDDRPPAPLPGSLSVCLSVCLRGVCHTFLCKRNYRRPTFKCECKFSPRFAIIRNSNYVFRTCGRVQAGPKCNN